MGMTDTQREMMAAEAARRARVVVPREFDRWARGGRLTEGQLATLGEQVTRYIRSQWAEGQAGWRWIVEQGSTWLVEQVWAVYPPLKELPLKEQYALCRLNRRRVEDQRPYALVAIRDKDAKRYFDAHEPRIRRDYSGLEPMEMVVGDVHPIDVGLHREDGTEVYPKAIAWQDVATSRLWMTLVLLTEREGIKRVHVAASFASLCAAWGLPQALYLDNGSEYSWAEMMEGFTELARITGGRLRVKDLDAEPRVRAAAAETRQHIVRSRPYNAPGKPKIEGAFAVVEQTLFKALPGWVAGNRMTKKTANVGRAPAPYPGSWEEFHGDVETLLTGYHKRPQYGHLEGKSPNEALREAIAAGWGKTAVSAAVLLARPCLRPTKREFFLTTENT